MSEGIGHRIAARTVLDCVVADHRGSVQRALDIPGLQCFIDAVGVLGPNARLALGLQLYAHVQGVLLSTGGRHL